MNSCYYQMQPILPSGLTQHDRCRHAQAPFLLHPETERTLEAWDPERLRRSHGEVVRQRWLPIAKVSFQGLKARKMQFTAQRGAAKVVTAPLPRTV
jgi:hypothetical protein